MRLFILWRVFTNKIIDMRMTDAKGRFQMFVSGGRYFLRVLHPAFREERRELNLQGKLNLVREKFKLIKLLDIHRQKVTESAI